MNYGNNRCCMHGSYYLGSVVAWERPTVEPPDGENCETVNQDMRRSNEVKLALAIHVREMNTLVIVNGAW